MSCSARAQAFMVSLLQLFKNFGWRIAAGVGTFVGETNSCHLAMPLIRDALLANDVLVTSWSTYHSHQLTDRLLQSTMESLKSRARGTRKTVFSIFAGLFGPCVNCT